MIRRYVVLTVVALFFSQSFAEFSLGIDFSSRFNNRFDSQSEDNNSKDINYDLSINPTFLIAVSDRVEVVPFAGFNFSHYNRYEDNESINDRNSFGFNFGGGVYFRAINGDIFRFSVGPKLQYSMNFTADSDWIGLTTILSAPANIDLRLTKRFFIRTSLPLVSVYYNLNNDTETEDRYNGNFSFDIITTSSMGISFFFTF